ncbi:coactosin [Anaeramoeba ignava]|uniref:Coactosin n=1 Tax=Anaeramoeba ignava TaxID=1746090 RepID=A0A9Q0LBL9_ANAIG|nr:coactosin [Anaeramoeba ignava]|eukprot:Anaeramoba_ignava/a478262_1383.p2 GENE.a478262_1383~~a478262_1383.p2  ORF type:complete len:144 (+),score=50.76 a478262_1383:53-484(+)
MCDTSDPAIKQAYDDVRDDSNETTWAVFSYEADSNKLQVIGTGTQSVDEFLPLLADDIVAYVYFRVISGDEESKRPKFVFTTWIGDNVKIMRKAKVSVHKADVKKIVRQFAVEMQAFDHDDLAIEQVMKEVRKAGGADYHGNW